MPRPPRGRTLGFPEQGRAGEGGLCSRRKVAPTDGRRKTPTRRAELWVWPRGRTSLLKPPRNYRHEYLSRFKNAVQGHLLIENFSKFAGSEPRERRGKLCTKTFFAPYFPLLPNHARSTQCGKSPALPAAHQKPGRNGLRQKESGRGRG